MDTYSLCMLFKLKALFGVLLVIILIYACGLGLLKHLCILQWNIRLNSLHLLGTKNTLYTVAEVMLQHCIRWIVIYPRVNPVIVTFS